MGQLLTHNSVNMRKECIAYIGLELMPQNNSLQPTKKKKLKIIWQFKKTVTDKP
jgi:hypothetical protein